jgi:flagellar basal-body rod protein FlgF
MNVSLYQAASALNAMDRWQETIAENLASASVPGFKKQDFSFAAKEAGLLPGSTSATTGTQHGSHALLMPTGSATTNFKPGEFRMTGVKTDVAIDGRGFFEVQLPNGQNALTRDGEFHVSSQGQLVTKEGFTVLGEGGPIQIDPNNYTELSISASGEVSQGADSKGRLKVSDVNDPRLLTRLSGGYFTATDPDVKLAPATGSSLRQGFVETGNTSVVMEMANLMTAMRTFEANQRMAQIHDERLGRAINDLGHITG